MDDVRRLHKIIHPNSDTRMHWALPPLLGRWLRFVVVLRVVVMVPADFKPDSSVIVFAFRLIGNETDALHLTYIIKSDNSNKSIRIFLFALVHLLCHLNCICTSEHRQLPHCPVPSIIVSRSYCKKILLATESSKKSCLNSDTFMHWALPPLLGRWLRQNRRAYRSEMHGFQENACKSKGQRADFKQGHATCPLTDDFAAKWHHRKKQKELGSLPGSGGSKRRPYTSPDHHLKALHFAGPPPEGHTLRRTTTRRPYTSPDHHLKALHFAGPPPESPTLHRTTTQRPYTSLDHHLKALYFAGPPPEGPTLHSRPEVQPKALHSAQGPKFNLRTYAPLKAQHFTRQLLNLCQMSEFC
ncbi:hypothetical protein M5K25_009322 [Dendrobium thyrsiflorum]|uniref:Uncharacterized protein n=1 Tax=Dendrobium thyrsiflorum TaxID=117978 RepID=A0ABD0VC58_DENTH